MTPWRSLVHWLRALVLNLFRGGSRDQELRADIDAYVDLLTDEKIAAGLPAPAARRAALMEVGNVDAVKESTRSARAGALLAEIGQDARYGLRLMRRQAGFTATAIVTLALGIGANTAIFSVINAVLFTPLPYHDAARLVVVWERNTGIGKERDPVAPLNYLDWRRRNSTVDEMGAYRHRSFVLANVPDPEQLQALSMSSSLFRALAVNAAAGRVFTDEEERHGERVVVLSHALWQRRFGGDPAVIGRLISLNGTGYTVVGVMPATFEFPDGNPVDLYTPLVFTRDELNGRQLHTLTVIARLKRDTTLDHARADLARIAAAIAVEDKTSNPDVTLAGAHDVLVEDVRLGLVVLFVTVGLVLLVACANVANLLMARATSRRREVAMRAALGAGRGRLLRQLLTESVLLAVLGAAAGLALADLVLSGVAQFAPSNLPRLDEVRIDGAVLLFVSAVALLTGLLFGTIPALQAASPQLHDATAGGRTYTAGARGRSLLLVTEIALSLLLLTGAGLMIRTLLQIQTLDLGFRARGVFTAQLSLPPARYPVDPAQFQPPRTGARPGSDGRPYLFFHELERRLAASPGVHSVGAVSALPLDPAGIDYDLPVVIEGRPRPRASEEPQADFRTATVGYFRTMGIPLIAGREFNEFDGPDSTPVAIINDILARELFPGTNPLGQRLVLYGRAREIVGVIGSVRHHGFTRDGRPEMILPYRQFQFGSMTLVVRTAVAAPAVAETIRAAVRSIDPQQPVYRIRAMNEFLADSVAHPRFVALLLTGFAALALALAVVGVYGVMSYTVRQRAREIAVRMALGARAADVIAMVIRQSLSVAAVGIIIGLAGALAAGRLIAGLLFGVTATDPATYVAAAASVLVASVLAGALPALRAAHTDPVSVLRAE